MHYTRHGSCITCFSSTNTRPHLTYGKHTAERTTHAPSNSFSTTETYSARPTTQATATSDRPPPALCCCVPVGNSCAQHQNLQPQHGTMQQYMETPTPTAASRMSHIARYNHSTTCCSTTVLCSNTKLLPASNPGLLNPSAPTHMLVPQPPPKTAASSTPQYIIHRGACCFPACANAHNNQFSVAKSVLSCKAGAALPTCVRCNTQHTPFHSRLSYASCHQLQHHSKH